jgi:hypothetical protein
LPLAYILPTISSERFSAATNFGVSSALVGGLHAYFVYPAQFSFAIDGAQQLVQLRLFGGSVGNVVQVDCRHHRRTIA